MEIARLASLFLFGPILYFSFAHCSQTLLNAEITQQGGRTNFTDLINQRPDGGDFPPAHVVSLLRSFNDKPECYKAATHQLITSCQSIREDTLHPKPSLEDLEKRKSIFAARLAICELREANANTPPQCKPIVSSSVAAYDGSSSSPSQLPADQQVCDDELRACLRALEAKPQSWTSYSNNRQHAALLCGSSRNEIIKDEALSLVRRLIGLVSDFLQALTDALRRTDSQQEAQRANAEALTDLHTEQVRDLAEAHQAHKAVIQESSDQLTNIVSYVFDKIGSIIGSVTNLEQMLKAIFLSGVTGGAELASIIQAAKEDSSGLQEVIHGNSMTANQTAQTMLFINGLASATARDQEISNALAKGTLKALVDAKENFESLEELFKPFKLVFRTLQTIFSKNMVISLAASAFMATSVMSISCCFGIRSGYYLAVVYLQAVTAGLVVRFVPLSDWAALILSNPRATVSILSMMAIVGLALQGTLPYQLRRAMRFYRKPQNAPSAEVELPGIMRRLPITTREVWYLPQQGRRRELDRSRRAQTTPPNL